MDTCCGYTSLFIFCFLLLLIPLHLHTHCVQALFIDHAFYILFSSMWVSEWVCLVWKNHSDVNFLPCNVTVYYDGNGIQLWISGLNYTPTCFQSFDCWQFTLASWKAFYSYSHNSRKKQPFYNWTMSIKQEKTLSVFLPLKLYICSNRRRPRIVAVLDSSHTIRMSERNKRCPRTVAMVRICGTGTQLWIISDGGYQASIVRVVRLVSAADSRTEAVCITDSEQGRNIILQLHHEH